MLIGEDWEVQNTDSDDESIEGIEKAVVKQLCGELVDEVFDEDRFDILQDYFDFQKRNKHSAKSLKRKACKVNLSKFVKNVRK